MEYKTMGDITQCTNKKLGFSFLIDTEDLDKINNRSWHIQSKGYVRGRLTKQPMVLLHRLILGLGKGTVGYGEVVDHVNGDKFDNRKCNLRVCDFKENLYGQNKRSRNKVGYKGVHRHFNKFRATVTKNGEMFDLGLYTTPEQAAGAYNLKAKELFGEFAKLNKGVL